MDPGLDVVTHLEVECAKQLGDLCRLQAKIPDYDITGFSPAQWNDGKAMQALVHALAQDSEIIGEDGDKTICAGHAALDVGSSEAHVANISHAMLMANEHFDVPMMGEAADFADPKGHEKELVMYLAYFQQLESDEMRARLISENADGERRGPVPIRRSPNGASHGDLSGCKGAS